MIFIVCYMYFRDGAHLSNQEIFEDLLEKHTVHPFCGKLNKSSEHYIVLDQRYCILQKDTIILHIAAVNNHLWCLEHKDDNFCVSVYCLTVSTHAGNSVHMSPIATYYLNVERKYTYAEMLKCSLHLAVSQVYAECHTVSSTCVNLSTQTFSTLFGMDIALSNALVLLASTPEGCVYFRPYTECHSPADNWQILCDAGNHVSFIANITLDKADAENTEVLFPLIDQPSELAPDAILVCCETGKMVVAAADSNGHICCETLIVPGSVSSWIYHAKHLFYSTMESVFRSVITRHDCNHQNKNMKNFFNVKTETIHDIRVSDMVLISDPLKHGMHIM